MTSKPVALNAYGFDLEIPRWSGSLSNYYYFGECFEWELINFARAFLRPGDVVLDVGANVGMFAYAAAQMLGSDGQVIAVEALPDASAVIENNAVRNLNRASIEVHKVAASDRKGLVRFTADLDVTNHLEFTRGNSRSQLSVEVASIRLDHLVRDRLITFAKFDVEGSELLALRGFEQNLAKSSPPVLSVEAHDHMLRKMGGSRQEVFDLLSEHGYEFFHYSVHTRTLMPADLSRSGDVLAIADEALVRQRLAARG